MTHQKTPLPLDGIKVLDFSTLLPGPLASLVLGDAGAQVIKVERPGGDDMRQYPPMKDGRSLTFELLNQNKQSLCLDLKSRQEREALIPLIGDCDIIIEQFRPGVMKRLGFDYETVKQFNPAVVYCSITGYGQSGPMASVAGHDLNYIAQTGLLSLAHGGLDNPVVPPVLAADIAGGSYPALVNILLALYARQTTGVGAHLDIAMTDNIFMLMSWALAQVKSRRGNPVEGGELLTGGSPRYQLYKTRDDKLLAAAPLEQAFWNNFCDVLKLPEQLRDDSSEPELVIAHIRKLIRDKDSSYWQELFAERDCCCCLVETLAGAMLNPHFQQRGLFCAQSDGGPDESSSLPVCLVPQFSRPKNSGTSAPEKGQDNGLLLGEEPK